jgi:hypothetical protein
MKPEETATAVGLSASQIRGGGEAGEEDTGAGKGQDRPRTGGGGREGGEGGGVASSAHASSKQGAASIHRAPSGTRAHVLSSVQCAHARVHTHTHTCARSLFKYLQVCKCQRVCILF